MDVLTTRTGGSAGRYELEHEIARGVMVTVHLARDVKHRRSASLTPPGSAP